MRIEAVSSLHPIPGKAISRCHINVFTSLDSYRAVYKKGIRKEYSLLVPFEDSSHQAFELLKVNIPRYTAL